MHWKQTSNWPFFHQAGVQCLSVHINLLRVFAFFCHQPKGQKCVERLVGRPAILNRTCGCHPKLYVFPYENHCILGYLVLVKNLLLAFPVNDSTLLNRFLSGTHSRSLQTDNGSFVWFTSIIRHFAHYQWLTNNIFFKESKGLWCFFLFYCCYQLLLTNTANNDNIIINIPFLSVHLE